MIIKKNETLLMSKWIFNGVDVELDDVGRRIEWLISNCLKEISIDATGWNRLYLDLNDNRYWELIYLDGEQQGGGAPTLRCLSANETTLWSEISNAENQSK
ncbi:MAG: Imm27 family immunity protein [Mangrovibacterium sp.]